MCLDTLVHTRRNVAYAMLRVPVGSPGTHQTAAQAPLPPVETRKDSVQSPLPLSVGCCLLLCWKTDAEKFRSVDPDQNHPMMQALSVEVAVPVASPGFYFTEYNWFANAGSMATANAGATLKLGFVGSSVLHFLCCTAN